MKGKKMNDRFDFESQITKCWTITDDISDLAESILEYDLSKDQITNALFGIKEINEIRFNKLWDLFEEVHMKLVRDERMAREDANALREQLIAETQGYGAGAAYTANSGAGRPSFFGLEPKEVPVIKSNKKGKK
jgi:hypothetical protein